MSYARYLTAVVTALRESALPEAQSGRARDAINNSINILAAVAAQLEAMPAGAPVHSGQLPAELREFASKLSTDAASGIRLPLAGPVDDYALTRDSQPLITAGARWLAAQPWPNTPQLRQGALTLLKWESGLRGEVMRRVHAAEQGLAITTASAGVAVINEAAVEAYLRKRFSSDSLRVSAFRFLPGGRVRQTALFTVSATKDIPSDLVIQREPASALTALRGPSMQFAVLQRAYAAGMKVAKPVLLEMSHEPLGAPFAITGQLRGKSPVASMDYWSPPLKSPKLAASLARQFAILHRMPIGDLEGVAARFVDPAQGQTWASDVESILSQLQSLVHAPSMAVSAALAWMRAHVGCVDGAECIVHNDALLHNVLAEDEEITAVLDWEFAHIGHPFEDLGYVRPVVEQMTAWSDFVDAYVAAGGRRPTQEQVDFFTLRSILQLLVQILLARGAFESGRTNDPNMAEVGAAFVPRLIDRLANQLDGILQRENT